MIQTIVVMCVYAVLKKAITAIMQSPHRQVIFQASTLGRSENIMRYTYHIDIRKQDDAVLDELVALVMKQARISTQRRTSKWEMRLDWVHLCVRFARKGHHDDFVDAFEEENAEFLSQNGFIADEPEIKPKAEASAPAFDWHGYIDRVARSTQRR